jgi:hypothetical protein
MDFKKLNLAPYFTQETINVWKGYSEKRFDNMWDLLRWEVREWFKNRFGVACMRKYVLHTGALARKIYRDRLAWNELTYIEMWRITFVEGEIRPREKRLCYTEIERVKNG